MESGITATFGVWASCLPRDRSVAVVQYERRKPLQINRRGTERDQGERQVDIENPTIKWDSNANALVLYAEDVKDFGYVQARHNYRILISLTEFADQLKEISRAARDTDATVSASLASSLPDLLHLALALVNGQSTQD